MRPFLPSRAQQHAVLSLLAVLLLTVACSTPDTYRQDAETQLALGAFEDAEATLRKGLEGHPENVALLLAAAEFYLRPLPEEHFRPRLALHYAMRADRASDNQSARATELLMQAWRANGGSPLGDAIVEQGLHQLGHPDQRAPVRLSPADPDLLEPSPENLREQARRDKERSAGQDPCGGRLAFVAGAAWPLSDGTSADLLAFCAERSATPGTCATKALRDCTTEENVVLCGPMRSVVGRHPSCVDPTVGRCCSTPRVAGSAQTP